MENNQRIDLINKATKAVRDIQVTEVTSIVRVEGYTFEEAVPTLRNVIALFSRVHIAQLPSLSDDDLNRILTHARQILEQIQAILSFNPKEHENTNTKYHERIAVFEKMYRKAYAQVAQLLGFIASGMAMESRHEDEIRLYFDRLREEFNSNIDKRLKSVDATFISARASADAIESSRKHADSLIHTIQGIAAESGVVKQSQFFLIEAEGCKGSAETWFRLTILMSVLLIAVAAFLLFGPEYYSVLKPDDLYSTIQLAVTKALIYATLTTLVLFSSRNYNSCKHNATINKHRHNALCTYQALVGAADDPSTRNIILNHAAACIFSDQPSGYSKHDITDSKMPSMFTMSPPVLKATAESST